MAPDGAPGRRVPSRRGPPKSALGLDLAGSPARRTGACELGADRVAVTTVLSDDASILEWARRAPHAVVAIDAPLSLPRGRVSLEARGPPHFRACDRELRRLGIPFFPLTLGPMRMLTARGMGLRGRLEQEGHRVIESYPGGVQDLLGWPRKGGGTEPLRRAMRADGFSGSVASRLTTHDELDAVACAVAGLQWARGNAVVLGDPAEGEIVLARSLPPRPRAGLGRTRT